MEVEDIDGGVGAHHDGGVVGVVDIVHIPCEGAADSGVGDQYVTTFALAESHRHASDSQK
mgnify:CR=1 FL=1